MGWPPRQEGVEHGFHGDRAGPTGLWVLDFDRNLLFHLAIKPPGR